MKRIFDLLAIVLLLLLATSVFFLFSFHPDRYKSDFLHWFNQQSDWQLAYKSSSWSLKKPLSLQVNGVELAKSGQAAILADQIQLTVAALPMLKGSIDFSSISAERLQIAITPTLFQHSDKPVSQAEDNQAFDMPWFDHITVQQLFIKDSDFTWQQAKQSYRLERFELAIEDWRIDLAKPQLQDWQFNLHSSAQRLVGPNQEYILPQVSLAYAEQQLVIDHIGADLLQGSLYASAELSNKQLRIRELAFSDARIEYLPNEDALSQQPTETSNTLSVNLPELSWLERVRVDNLLLNQISIAAQIGGHNFTLNRFTGELENLDTPWPIDSQHIAADYAFIADEFGIDHIQFNQLTASGSIAQGSAHLAALRSEVFEGQLSLALSYQWQQQALTIHQLGLSNTEIPIQPSWVNNLSTDSLETDSRAPLQQLNIEKVELKQVKLLSYVDQLPFSAEGLNLELRQLMLIRQGQWQNIEQLWQANSQAFVEAPELAFRGLVLSHVNMDIGSEQQVGYFNLYGELPLGQFELQGQVLLDQENKPWQAELSGLLLDISPLGRLANHRDFKLIGDLEIAGKLRGKLTDFGANIDGSVDIHSQLIQIPGADLETTLDQIIESPRQYYEDPNPLISMGWPVLWQAPNSLPKGITQLTNLNLKAELEQGKLTIAPQPLNGLRYQLTLAGEVNLAKQRFNQLKLIVSDQPCWRLAHIIHGPWEQPAVSFDHYLSPRRYLVKQQEFVAAPSIPNCRYPLDVASTAQ
ncbi:hypothetical protein ACVFI8_08715 [Agarivorans sp. MS3-6]